MALAAEGGYDAVVMRDLAEQANVAVGTLYNYFTSKDHLLAAAWVEWSTELEDRIAGRPPRGDAPADRVIDVLGRMSRSLELQPKLVSAILTAANSHEPEVVELDRQVSEIIWRMIGGALQLDDPDTQARVTEVLAHVWHSALLGWINGGRTMDEVVGAIDNAAHLLLDPGNDRLGP